MWIMKKILFFESLAINTSAPTEKIIKGVTALFNMLIKFQKNNCVIYLREIHSHILCSISQYYFSTPTYYVLQIINNIALTCYSFNQQLFVIVHTNPSHRPKVKQGHFTLFQMHNTYIYLLENSHSSLTVLISWILCVT